MTNSEAARILIRHAAANIRGSAQGLRPEITIAQRSEVITAIECLFRSAHGREMDDSDKFNLGI